MNYLYRPRSFAGAVLVLLAVFGLGLAGQLGVPPMGTATVAQMEARFLQYAQFATVIGVGAGIGGVLMASFLRQEDGGTGGSFVRRARLVVWFAAFLGVVMFGTYVWRNLGYDDPITQDRIPTAEDLALVLFSWRFVSLAAGCAGFAALAALLVSRAFLTRIRYAFFPRRLIDLVGG